MSENDGSFMPIGKHKGEPIVSVLETDPSYCEWLAQQPWFREKYGTTYNVIINYGGQPQDSPEHNQMQARFLDDDFCIALLRYLLDKDLTGWQIVGRGFEDSGWDARYNATDDSQYDWNPAHARWVFAELKPDLGDDFPAALRQVKRYPMRTPPWSDNADLCIPVVLVRRATFEQVTWEQVAAIYSSSGVELVKESWIG